MIEGAEAQKETAELPRLDHAKVGICAAVDFVRAGCERFVPDAAGLEPSNRPNRR
jgi:hypothetical protein